MTNLQSGQFDVVLCSDVVWVEYLVPYLVQTMAGMILFFVELLLQIYLIDAHMYCRTSIGSRRQNNICPSNAINEN